MRSHHCNELRESHIGQTVTLIGWVNSARDHGGVIFIDLRDREGLTQVVFRPEEHPQVSEDSHKLRSEDVIQITGRVAARLAGTENAKLGTGDIEVIASELSVLNKADVPPFPLDDDAVNEDLRLSYRYLDLRRTKMQQNLRLRHRIVKSTRDYLDEAGFLEIETPILSNPTPEGARDFLDEQGYLEIETPILSKSTPEGARDFLVPSRLNPGKFYALPQAPQQYKQLLQVAGVEKYFQIARCFRDEDLRADRQPEFTQIDVEASFVGQDDIIALIEGVLGRVFKDALDIEIEKSFLRLTHREAMERFGSDKPDLRFGMEIVDLGDVFATSTFKVFSGALASGGVVKAINAKGFACVTTGQINSLTETAQLHGAKGLAFIKVEDGQWKSPIVKFFTDEEKAALTEKLGIEEGDLILFGADKWETACEVLGRIRLEVCRYQNLLEGNTDLKFLWVTEFPLLAYSAEDDKWNAVHHPFTRPHADDVALLDAGEYAKVRAEAYDVVLNGYELGGGSIRIHEPDLQSRMFTVLGVTEEEKASMFGHLLTAFSYGAPPHGGVALGLDRLVMLVCGEDSIREVIAFPKNNRGIDIMSASPADVDFKQLRELYVKSTYTPKKEETPEA